MDGPDISGGGGVPLGRGPARPACAIWRPSSWLGVERHRRRRRVIGARGHERDGGHPDRLRRGRDPGAGRLHRGSRRTRGQCHRTPGAVGGRDRLGVPPAPGAGGVRPSTTWPCSESRQRACSARVGHARAAASKRGVELRCVEARTIADAERAFTGVKATGRAGLLVLPDALFAIEQRRIVALAALHRMPALYSARSFVEAGGLMALSGNAAEVIRRAAAVVARVLAGARPASLARGSARPARVDRERRDGAGHGPRDAPLAPRESRCRPPNIGMHQAARKLPHDVSTVPGHDPSGPALLLHIAAPRSSSRASPAATPTSRPTSSAPDAGSP